MARASALRDAGGLPRRLLRLAAAAHAAPGSSGATPCSWRSGPSTPRSRPATAARASTPSWWPAATTAASTPSPSSCATHGIAAKTARKFRCTTTDSNHDLPVAENLLDRQFDPARAQRGLGGGHHLHPDPRGLAVPGRRRGPVLAARRRLVDGRAHGEPPGRGRPGAGGAAAPARTRGCWRTRTEAASTPANTTNSSWPSTASRAA